MNELLDWMVNADQHLGAFIGQYGELTYLLLFLVIFIETGLVVVAFFPGDGLLFPPAFLLPAVPSTLPFCSACCP